MSRFLCLLAFRPEGDGTGEGAAPPERPAWLPQQFETPEALAQSYDESRREMDRMRSQMEADRTQFSAALEALETRTPAPAPNGEAFDPTLAAITRAYEEGDYATAARLQGDYTAKMTVPAVAKLLDDRFAQLQPTLDQQTQAQRESSIRMAEDLVKTKIGADRYTELLPTIRTLVTDHPHYLPAASSVEGYAAAIEDVAKLAQHETLAQRVVELEAERQDKLAAQTVSGAGRPSVYTADQQKAEFERIKATELGSYGGVVRGG